MAIVVVDTGKWMPFDDAVGVGQVEVFYGPSGSSSYDVVNVDSWTVSHQGSRLQKAFELAGFTWPTMRTAVNVVPATMRGNYPDAPMALDLPIAIGILVVTGQLDASLVYGIAFAGAIDYTGRLQTDRNDDKVTGELITLSDAINIRRVITPTNLGIVDATLADVVETLQTKGTN